MNLEGSEWRSLTLRRDGKCSDCGKNLAAGTNALWSPSLHLVKCLAHKNSDDGITLQTPPGETEIISNVSEEPINFGTPGGSAKAENERRMKRREERVTTRFP